MTTHPRLVKRARQSFVDTVQKLIDEHYEQRAKNGKADENESFGRAYYDAQCDMIIYKEYGFACMPFTLYDTNNSKVEVWLPPSAFHQCISEGTDQIIDSFRGNEAEFFEDMGSSLHQQAVVAAAAIIINRRLFGGELS